MVSPRRELNPLVPGPGPMESEPLLDLEAARRIAGFAARGLRRHPVCAGVVFTLVAAVGVTLALTWPRTWHVEAKLLASRSQVIRTLGNPRMAGLQADDPTRAAAEIVVAHSNLRALIRQTNLLERYEAARSPLVRWRDGLVRLVSAAPNEEDRLDALIGTLEKKLTVKSDVETVVIAIDWPDGEQAYQIVEAAQQSFLESRHVTEMAAISDALSILEGHAATVQSSVDDALRELQWVRESRRKGTPRPAAPPQAELPPPPLPVARAPEPTVARPAYEQELAQLKFLLNSKRRALADLEDFRARRIAELNTQLAEQRVQYATQHPAVLDTLQRIDALQQDSPQSRQLKGEIEGLLAEYERKGGRNPDALVEPARARSARAGSAAARESPTSLEVDEDPLVQFSRDSLRVESAKYDELVMRIDAARIEQDAARAAFKYRYSVVRPAEPPKKPVKPNLALGLVAVVLAATVLGGLSGGLLDTWRGRVVEAWQVTDQTGLPVLAEVVARGPGEPARSVQEKGAP